MAAKRFKIPNGEQGFPLTTLREILALEELSHDYIVKMIAVIQVDKKVIMFLEYMEMDLAEFILNHGAKIPKILKQCFKQVLSAMSYCHSKRYLHRDLKPSNILVTYNNEKEEILAKVADFGLSKQLSKNKLEGGHSPEVITRYYKPPEILLKHDPEKENQQINYCTSVDVWSLACIFAEMVMCDF
jgi:serine/threonine protein kinase